MAKRKMYNTTLDVDLTKEIRILAAQLDKRQNELLEEAIQDLIKKYKHQESSMDVPNGWIDHKSRIFFMSDILIISAISMTVVSNAFVLCTAMLSPYK